jgi:tripartite-type tricarboxylate transporter receptor subunit TctC
MKWRHYSVLFSIGLLIAVPPSHAAATGYPSQPIRLVVPFAPGGTTDLFGRLIGKGLSQKLGVTVVIDNRAGAGGNIGSAFVVQSTPDGHTLLLGGAGHLVISPSLGKTFPFDPYMDLQPVSLVGTAMNVLVASTKLPFQHVDDIVAYARAKPGELNYASGGNGGVIHLAGELFSEQAGVKLAHVPYKGSSGAYGDLISGRVQIMFDNLPSALPHIRSKQLNAIAVTGTQRSVELPDTPTMREQGLPDYEASSWWGVFAPAATPKPIVEKLNRALREVVQEESDAIVKLGANPAFSSPNALAIRMRQDGDKWGAIIKRAGITVD